MGVVASGSQAASHEQLVDAFLGIPNKNALAWSVLDEKSERAISTAIALSANTRAGVRVACVEHQRLDLVFMDGRTVHTTYQAKAAYLSDYTEKRIAKRDIWLGEILNEDFGKLAARNERISSVRASGCLFYLYEVADPSRQMKYARPSNEHSAAEAIEIMRSLVRGRFNSSHVIDCGKADGTNVQVHLVIFDPMLA